MVSNAVYPPSDVQQSNEAAQGGVVTSAPQHHPAMVAVPLDSTPITRQPERQPAMQLRGGGCVKDCCAACLCCCALEEICCCEIDEFCC